MANNTTGGIILFILGAVIITMGVSEKGKRVFNILVGGGSGTPAEKESIFDGSKELDPKSDSKDDPEWKKQNGNQFGFVGEKGAGPIG